MAFAHLYVPQSHYHKSFAGYLCSLKGSLFFSLKVRTSAPISPRSSSLQNSCRPSADYDSALAQHLTHWLRPGSQPSISPPSDSPVTPQKSSSCTPKHPMMLGTHNPLGHSSNQVNRSLTHTWHLRAFLTSTHRLSEPCTLMFGVTYLILGNVLNDFSSNPNS